MVLTVKRATALVVAGFMTSCALFTDLGGLTDAPSETPEAGTPDAQLGDGGGATVVDAAVDARSADADAAFEPGAAYVAEVLADAPSTYLRFDDGSSDVAKDRMGRVNGAYLGAVERGVAGVLGPDGGSAIRFPDIAGSLLSLGDTYDFASNAPFTFEAWIFPEIVDASYRRLAGKVDGTTTGWSLGIFTPQGCSVSFQVDGGTTLGFGSNGGIAQDQWTHLVVTYDGTTLTTYRNGVAGNAEGGATSLRDTGVNLILGATANGFSRFKGRLDELAIYDKALGAGRVKAHFDAAK